MAYLAAITAATGVPLFIRTKGEVPPLSFPVVGSLNGVQLYATNLKAALLSTTSGGATVLWKTFHDSITLILVTAEEEAGSSGLPLSHLLELCFNAMLLLVGLPALEEGASNERLKSELKSCYPLLDYILKGDTSLLCPLTQSVDVLALDDSAILERTLEAFTLAVESNYGCLLVNSRMGVATQSWWELAGLDSSLLSLLHSSLSAAHCRDLPVFLPVASNSVPHRLLVFTVLEGVDILVLCGAEPSLLAVQKQLHVYWSQLITTLRNAASCYPRCVPLGVTFPPAVLAFCLVNIASQRCLSSLKPSAVSDALSTSLSAGFQGSMSVSKRLSYLVRFYATVVDSLLPPQKEKQSQDVDTEGDTVLLRERLAPDHMITETYLCSKDFKAYALHKKDYNLFVLFNTQTPTFSLRKLAYNVYSTLVEKRTVSSVL